MPSWFPFKKTDKPAGGEESSAGAAEAAFQADPVKARKWFDHGRTMLAASNYEYALTCFASGVKFDPGNMEAHQAFWEAAVQYFNAGGKPATGKEVKQIDGPGAVDRFAAAEFAWMKDLNNLSLALKTLTAAAKAEQFEYGRWVAPRVKNIAFKQKKPSKSVYIQAKDAFAEVGAWDEAFQCGEAAVRIDPSDNQLMAELKELTAQRAIAQGGYAEAAGREGGFRSSIRDAEKQRALEEKESLSGGAETEARNLERAREEYEANPLSPEAVTRYAQLLRRTEAGEEQAHGIYLKAFEDLREFRFRMAAGDIRIAQGRRRLRRLEAEGDPGLEKARDEQRALETAEFRTRAEKYPTDKAIRFELGRLEFERGNYDEAMAAFQAAKEDARFRVAAAHMLGRCFAAEGWHQEAVGEFREALEVLDASDKDKELELRYDLMGSLLAGAREESSLGMAKEAAEICSAIVRRDITFRDIRAKRKEVDALIRDLGGAS